MTPPKPALPAIAHLARAARAGDKQSLVRIRDAVADALKKHDGNRDRTARELGVSSRVLDYWLLPLTEPKGLGLEKLAERYPAQHRGRPALPVQKKRTRKKAA